MVLCFSGLVFGVVRIVFQFLNSYILFTLVPDFVVFVSYSEHSPSWTWCSVFSIKVLLPIKKIKNKKNQSKSPQSVDLFTWTTALKKLLITDNLRMWGIIIANWYCMSKSNMVDRLFLHCDIKRETWTLVLCLFRVRWVNQEYQLNYWHLKRRTFGRQCSG